jgi:phage replication-related protein YjqB (UPF0714/DUF867 family)
LRGIRWRLELAAGLLLAAMPAWGKDFYADFSRLAAKQKAGLDYSITAVNVGSSVTVFAIHAGGIEPGTGEIARMLAGGGWNLYLFEGLLQSDNRRLHVTATHFDEPAAVALATASLVSISVHGEKDAGSAVCVGGGNARLRHWVGLSLAQGGFAVEEPCRRLPGEEKANIANRGRRAGVQLEMPRAVIDSLLTDPRRMEDFRLFLRRAVLWELSS